MMRKEKKTTWNFIGSQSISFKRVFIGCAVLLLLFSSFLFKSFEVKGRSMSGTIEPGSHVVINRLFGTSLDNGDIVVLKKDSVLFVKRIHKIAGDTLKFDQIGIQGKNGAIPHDKIYFAITSDLKNYRVICEHYSKLLLRKPVFKHQVEDRVFLKKIVVW